MKLNPSIHTRILLAASIVLAAFLSASGFALDRAFRSNAETALRDRLQGHVYALLAAAEVNGAGQLRLARPLADPRFTTPGSGLYAEIDGPKGQSVWQSPSQLGVQIPFAALVQAGRWRYRKLSIQDGTTVLALSFTVLWEDATGADQRFTFHVAQNLKPLEAQVAGFRHTLWGWLAALALLLLGAQGLVLRWGLAPLRRVADDLAAIETGAHEALEGGYPRELDALTANLNELLRHQRAHLERYRNTLGDLAHSLKTPLAVLGGVADDDGHDQAALETIREQVMRMREIVDYQLQRAATSGMAPLAAPIPVAPVVDTIVATLGKVYADKAVQFDLSVDAGARFRGEQGDLMELLGNLLDNACKWARQRVSIGVRTPRGSAAARLRLQLEIEDDGPGIPAAQAEEILQRGVRADSRTPGHGIGLAMVRDIVDAYGGTLTFGASPLGGAKVEVDLPG